MRSAHTINVAADVTDLIGNTPLVRLNSFDENANILAKLESFNLAHSVKDRIGVAMIERAEEVL